MRKVFIISTFAIFAFFIFWVLRPFAPPEPEMEGLCSPDDWCWQNPLPHGYNFSCIHFMDELNGLIVGFNGTIFRTSDGGETWVKTNPPVEGIEIDISNHPDRGWFYYDCWDLGKFQFVNDSVGWAVGNNGAILKTTNGGNTWISQHSIQRTSYTPHFNSLFFINEFVGWVVGYKRIPVGMTRVLKHTTDGGETWDVHLPGPMAAIESLNDVFFSDDQTGWAVGKNGVIIHTSDGGQNWQTQDSGTNKNLSAITFIDAQAGWITGGGIILHTQNGGDSWQVQAEGDWTLSSIAFRNDRVGLAVGSSGVILLTINAGNDWIQVGAEDVPVHSGQKPFLRHVIFLNNLAWVVGNRGCILRSDDSGISWTYKGSTGPRHYLKQVSFMDANTGWALSNHVIMRTIDGGMHWSEQSPLPPTACDEEPFLLSMSFVDTDYGWAACWCNRGGFRGNKLLHTTNGGQTWSEQYSSTEPNSSFDTVFFIDRSKGWLTSTNHDGETFIMHTIDGGETWAEQYRGSYMGNYPNDMTDLDFVDAYNGWLILRVFRNRILQTNDGGNTWHEEQIQELSKIAAASFITPNEGWAFGRDSETGYDGTLVHTTDGGQTWEKMDYETKWNLDTLPECMAASLTSMTFIDENHGWVCGYNGEIWYTADGGKTWIHQKTGTHAILSSIGFVNSDTGWVVGSEGTIMHHNGVE